MKVQVITKISEKALAVVILVLIVSVTGVGTHTFP